MISETDIEKHIDNHLKPWLDAGRILNSGYLTKLGVKRCSSKGKEVINLIGECIQHSAPSAPPHRIEIILQRKNNSDFGYTIVKAHCPCYGGDSGKCKHAVAVLRSVLE